MKDNYMKIKQLFFAAAMVVLVTAAKAQAASNSVTLPTPYPSSGQTWSTGSPFGIQWTVPVSSNSSTVSVSLIPYSSTGCQTSGNNTTCSTSSPYILNTSVPNNGYYNASSATDITGAAIPPGQYLVNIYDNNNNNFAASGLSGQVITVPAAPVAANTPSNLTPTSADSSQKIQHS